MNQTIRLYVNIAETRQRKRLEILRSLNSIQGKILRLKTCIITYSRNLDVRIFTSLNESEYQIFFNTSEYPYKLYFFLPQNIYEEFTKKSLANFLSP